VDTQISIIKGYTVFQRVAEKLRLIPAGSSEQDGQLKDQVIRVIEGLQSRVEVEREGATSILNIMVTDKNPVFAQKLANTIALTYKELHAEQQTKETTEALQYIGEQLKDVREKLRKAEEEFNRFTQDNELISIDLQSEDLLARVKQIQDEIRELQDLRREFEGIVQRLNQFIENPSGSDHDFHSTNAIARYQSTNDTLVALLLKRDTLLKDFTPKHPEVVAINHQIIENARKMEILLQLQMSDMEKKEIALRRELEEVSRKTKVLMDKKLEYDRLKRRVELYNGMTVLLEKKNQEALIKRAAKPEEVNIVKPALLPTQPINPPKTAATGAAGVMIGLVLGIVIGFVVETFDTSLGAIEDVEETLETQVLGIVPQADIKDMIEGLKEKYPDGISLPDEKRMGYLVSHFVPKSMMSESFRALRTNVQFKGAEKKTKAVAVTSSSPQEGKTLVAVNLAIAMAQARMKVLLVGSDLRKPSVDKVFDLEMKPGLTDILMENYQWRDTVKTVMDMAMGEMTQTQIIRTPGLDNLHIITSGAIPPNPAELIDSTTFAGFIEEAKEDYDMIIFDSPPILSTADAAILGAKVDGVLLVYHVGAVSKGLLKRSVTQLQQVKSNIMGVILNGMRPEVSPDFQDYKYYSYYYSYGEEGEEKRLRDRKKGWTFLGRKEERKESSSLKKEGRGKQKQEARKSSGRGLLLLLMATAILAVGILWHNGLINPFRAFEKQRQEKKDEIKPDAKIGVPLKTGTEREPKSASVKPMGVEFVDEPEVKHETRDPQAQAKSKSSSAAKRSAVKKEISKETLKRETQPVAGTPAEKASEGKPDPGIEAPIPESQPLPQTQVGTKGPIMTKEISEQVVQGKPDVIYKESKTVASHERPAPDDKTAISGSPSNAKPVSEIKAAAHFKNVVSYPYSIRLGAFRTSRQAQKAVSHYEKKGLSPYWVKVELDDETWYRVYMGDFESAEQAEEFRRRHGLMDAMVKKTRYATLINPYVSAAERERQLQSLRQLGYSPYVIAYDDSQSRLFAGTFVTKEGAEKQRRELESKGIQSQVVER
jgi:tyrosine-protein kinase Etk/Wzc